MEQENYTDLGKPMEQQSTAPQKNQSEIYGTFFLGKCEFALDVLHFLEVSNAPESYTNVPLAPVFLKGLFNLRGSIIPVVDLSTLLNIETSDSEENKKIAIIEFQESCIGLLFNHTGEVLKCVDDEINEFGSSDDSVVVRGAIKKEAGKRIIQILDFEKIFSLKKLPKGHHQNHRQNIRASRIKLEKYISFTVGLAKFAFPISDIQEIIQIDKIDESSLKTGNCIGTIDLRGYTIPIVDFPATLNYRELRTRDEQINSQSKVLVLKLGKDWLGLMVDSVDSIIPFNSEDIVSFPMFDQNRVNMFEGCISDSNNKDVILLNYEKIFSDKEISNITHGHSCLFSRESEEKIQESSKGDKRSTYISFRLDTSYAISITDIKEIIEYPKNLLHPPGLEENFKGVLNLRGNLVTIIDVRTVYHMNPKSESKTEEKVLIFEKDGAFFGIVVDDVESIISFSEKNKIKLSPVLYRNENKIIHQDVSEAIQITDNEGVEKNLLVFNIYSILERCSASSAKMESSSSDAA